MSLRLADLPLRRGSSERGGFAGAVGLGVVALIVTLAGVTWLLELPDDTLALVAMATAGLLLVALAFVDAARWLLLAMVLRPLLDSVGPADGDALSDPAALFGVLVIGVAGTWLYVEHRRGELRPPGLMVRYLGAFVALASFSIVISESAGESVKGVLRMLSAWLILLCFEQMATRWPERRKEAAWALLAAMVIPAAVAFQQLLAGGEVDISIAVTRIRGTFTHPNSFATALAAAVVLALGLAYVVRSPWQRRALRTLGLVFGILVVFTYARSALIGLVLGLLVLGWRLDRRLVRGTAAVAVVVLIAVPSVVTRFSDVATGSAARPDVGPNSLQWRIEHWGELLPIAGERPLTGIGLGASTEVSGAPPHSVFVQAFVEMGVPGLVLLLVVIAALACDLRRARRRAGTHEERAVAAIASGVAATFLVQALTENLITQAVSNWYVFAILALGISVGADRPSRRLSSV